MSITFRVPGGYTIHTEVLRKGAEGSWFCHSPPVRSYIGTFRIFEPSAGCKVVGIWLGVGRENELVGPVPVELFDAVMTGSYDPVWSEPMLEPRSLVTLLIDGTAGHVIASFKNYPPLQVRGAGLGDLFTKKDFSS